MQIIVNHHKLCYISSKYYHRCKQTYCDSETSYYLPSLSPRYSLAKVLLIIELLSGFESSLEISDCISLHTPISNKYHCQKAESPTQISSQNPTLPITHKKLHQRGQRKVTLRKVFPRSLEQTPLNNLRIPSIRMDSSFAKEATSTNTYQENPLFLSSRFQNRPSPFTAICFLSTPLPWKSLITFLRS